MTRPALQSDAQIHVRVVENIDRAVIALDCDGRIALFNPAAQNMSGLSERQTLGKSFETLFAGQDGLLYLVRLAIREGRSVSDQENIVLRRAIGAPIAVSVTVSPLYDERGEREGVVLILRDLTRIRELEEAVRRADRLSMLGALAAGLAHEIKNPLGGIKGAAQLLALELDATSGLHEYTTVMIRETERINGIIEELMNLTTSRPTLIQPVDLGRLLDEQVLLQREAWKGKGVVFTLDLDPSIPPLPGDEQLLIRLFLNLIKNAAEAITGTGRVEIATRVAADLHLQQPGSRLAPMIQVEIRDSGQGIAQADLDTIFTPFYTTKERGSGLGLAICQKIVVEHRGFMKFESSPGNGTTVTVHLPLVR